MKRLLKISFDMALLTLFPLLGYFWLSIVIDKNLISIFTICYPIYFFFYIIKAIFGTGANIHKQKDKNSNAVLSGLVTGSIIAIIIYGIVLLFVDNYITYMNMDINIYKTFVIYSIIQTIIQTIFTIIIEKLYYEENNNLANIYSIIFNVLNFIILVIVSLITKNQIIIATVTLLFLALFTVYLFFKSFKGAKLKYKLDIIKCIKYSSIEVVNYLFFFFIFLFGISNNNQFGIEYTMALSFITLITDTQWDLFMSIVTAAKIDISKNRFNYKQHLRNAYKLDVIIIISVIMMFLLLFNYYNLDLKIALIFLAYEILNFLLFPIYKIKTSFLQLEYSTVKSTTNETIANILRLIVSCMKITFCSAIGGFVSTVYQTISYGSLFKVNYKVNKLGEVEKR